MSWGEMHFRLLEHLAPPSILVDQEHDILHLSPGAGRYLQFGGGEPSKNLLRTVHPELRIELRAALYQAAQTGGPVVVPSVPVEIDGGAIAVTLRVQAVPELAADVLLVTLAAAAANEPQAALEPPPVRIEPDPVSRQLERELARLKSHLRDTVEQYEASTEELKASNEELQAMQGHELGHANSDMLNLMDATAIATVFLDRELRIKRYTPSAVSLFNLIATDIGRPLADLSPRLAYGELGQDAQRVLQRLAPIEREVGQPGGR